MICSGSRSCARAPARARDERQKALAADAVTLDERPCGADVYADAVTFDELAEPAPRAPIFERFTDTSFDTPGSCIVTP